MTMVSGLYAAVAVAVAAHAYHRGAHRRRRALLAAEDRLFLALTALVAGAFWALFIPLVATRAVRGFARRRGRAASWGWGARLSGPAARLRPR
jgi:Zn-dependent protease with chaperone function